eukprot:6214118-Pleurochrysis_carterae.AAC.3
MSPARPINANIATGAEFEAGNTAHGTPRNGATHCTRAHTYPHTSSSERRSQPKVLLDIIYVTLRKRRMVPFVAGEGDDGMATLIHRCPSEYSFTT